MIIYLLLKAIMFILEILAGLFGDLIPSFPDVITDYFEIIWSYIYQGMNIFQWFFYKDVVYALLVIVLSWYVFLFIKDNVMKIVGHFLGN